MALYFVNYGKIVAKATAQAFLSWPSEGLPDVSTLYDDKTLWAPGLRQEMEKLYWVPVSQLQRRGKRRFQGYCGQKTTEIEIENRFVGPIVRSTAFQEALSAAAGVEAPRATGQSWR